MPDEDPPKNPFVRWKHHVDASIGLTLNGLVGLPSIISKNLTYPGSDGNFPRADNAGFASRRPRRRDSQPLPEEPAAPAPMALSPQLLEFKDFLHNSPYSPLNLQHLPQPIPRGAPPEVDPYAFTFSDAFEDLLVASSGLPMTSLRRKYYLNSERRQFRLDTVPDLAWAWWLNRLQYGRLSSLLDAYFPQRSATEGVEASDSDDRWNRDEQKDTEHDWKQQAAEAYREEGNTKEPSSSRTDVSDGLFGELDHVLKVLGRVMNDEFGVRGSRREDRREGTTQNELGEPDTEEDLYSAVKSAFNKTEKSLSTFIKSIAEGKFSSEVDTSVSTSKSTSCIGDLDQDNRTVRTTDEHVDIFGNRHVKTVVRTLNADGDEIARETHYQIRSDWQTPRAAEENEDDQDDADDDYYENERRPQPRKEDNQMDGTGNQKKTGWFWK